MNKYEWLEGVMASQLSNATKVFAFALFTHMNKEGQCWPGEDTIRQVIGRKSRGHFNEYRRALVDSGWINLEDRKTKAGNSFIYSIPESAPTGGTLTATSGGVLNDESTSTGGLLDDESASTGGVLNATSGHQSATSRHEYATSRHEYATSRGMNTVNNTYKNTLENTEEATDPDGPVAEETSSIKEEPQSSTKEEHTDPAGAVDLEAYSNPRHFLNQGQLKDFETIRTLSKATEQQSQRALYLLTKNKVRGHSYTEMCEEAFIRAGTKLERNEW